MFEEQKKYPIRIVQNEQDLEILLSELGELEEGMYIGYDSEFKPYHLIDVR